jgi:hypothetical protein
MERRERHQWQWAATWLTFSILNNDYVCGNDILRARLKGWFSGWLRGWLKGLLSVNKCVVVGGRGCAAKRIGEWQRVWRSEGVCVCVRLLDAWKLNRPRILRCEWKLGGSISYEEKTRKLLRRAEALCTTVCSVSFCLYCRHYTMPMSNS